MKWTLYDSTLNSIPLYAINTASNWAEFSAALKQWCWPTQNVVYSDDQGHIGYHAIGRMPIRPEGLVEHSRSAMPQHEWQGYIPFDDLPNAFDPPSGFLATANSRVTSAKSKYPLTNEWADPYRAERIYKLLQGRDHLTPADMLAVQTDIYSEMDQEMAHRLAYAIDHTAECRRSAAQGRRPAAQLGRPAHHGLRRGLHRGQHALHAAADASRTKLGKDLAKSYQWSESNFAEEEIVMHASPDWLPPDYKDWDAFLADGRSQALKERQRAHRPEQVDVRQLARRGDRASALRISALHRPHGRDGRQPLSGDTLR